MLYDSKPFEKVEMEQKMIKLHYSLWGENRYQYLRPKAFVFQAYHSDSMASDTKIDREQIKEMNRLKRMNKGQGDRSRSESSSSMTSRSRTSTVQIGKLDPSIPNFPKLGILTPKSVDRDKKTFNRPNSFDN